LTAQNRGASPFICAFLLEEFVQGHVTNTIPRKIFSGQGAISETDYVEVFSQLLLVWGIQLGGLWMSAQTGYLFVLSSTAAAALCHQLCEDAPPMSLVDHSDLGQEVAWHEVRRCVLYV
jgi:hypothetical protein